MLLAMLRGEHGSELRSDMQRYFGLDLSKMGIEFSVFHASCCASNLPSGSATLARIDRRLQWSMSDVLLSGIRNAIVGKEHAFYLEGYEPFDGGVFSDIEEIPMDEFMEWYRKPKKEAGCQSI